MNNMYSFLFTVLGKELLEVGTKKLPRELDKKKDTGPASQQKTVLNQLYQYR